MRILHVAAEITDDGNGLAEFVRNLSLAQREMGDDPIVLTHAGICDFCKPQPRHSNFLYYSKEFARQINNLSAKVDFIHLHGSWTFPIWHGAQKAQLSHLHYCVTPHGSFDPVRMAHSAWKKRLATPFDQSVLQRAAFVQATCENEIQWCCNFAHIPKEKISVIPPGIELPPQSIIAPPPLKNRNHILYLGRLHPLKGIDLLLEAFATSKIEKYGASLTICGRDEENTKSKLQDLTDSLRISDKIRFSPPVTGSQKWELLSRCGLVVLPSRSENFGIVVGEALAAHRPVIATTATPWTILSQEKCGFFVPPTIQGISNALTSFFEMSAQDRKAMGERGAKYVADNYSYESVAMSLQKLYQKHLKK